MPIATTPQEGEQKTRRMAMAIVSTIDAVDGGEGDNAVVNGALAGVIGLLAMRQGDPDIWIAGLFDIVRKMRNGEFNKQ